MFKKNHRPVKHSMIIFVEADCKTKLMLKFIFYLFFLGCFSTSWAQEVPLTAGEKASLDSMFKNDEFLKMLNQEPDSSFVDVSVGVSNGVFSLKNNSLNA